MDDNDMKRNPLVEQMHMSMVRAANRCNKLWETTINEKESAMNDKKGNGSSKDRLSNRKVKEIITKTLSDVDVRTYRRKEDNDQEWITDARDMNGHIMEYIREKDGAPLTFEDAIEIHNDLVEQYNTHPFPY